MFDLSQVSIFSVLDDAELSFLKQNARAVTFKRNAVIVTEGGEQGPMYVMESGRARVFMTDSNGKEFNINHLGPGDYFGELSLFDSQPRSASVLSTEDSRLLLISKEVILKLLNNPEFSRMLIKDLVLRTRVLSAKLCTMACRGVYDRIVQFFAEQSEESQGQRITKLAFSHEDIAHNIGSTRESVTRILSSLESAGFIERYKDGEGGAKEGRKSRYVMDTAKLGNQI